MKVRYDPEAVADLARIALRHHAPNIRATLNIRADIDATIRRVALNPLSYGLVGQDDIRRAVTRAYRYLVYFRIAEGTSIVVLCIRHGAQRPRYSGNGD